MKTAGLPSRDDRGAAADISTGLPPRDDGMIGKAAASISVFFSIAYFRARAQMTTGRRELPGVAVNGHHRILAGYALDTSGCSPDTLWIHPDTNRQTGLHIQAKYDKMYL